MKYVYAFAEGSREMREPLGGQGAGVAEMTRVLGPDQGPAGFTITTVACVAYMKGTSAFPRGSRARSLAALAALEERTSRRLGDRHDPLLVSVRSGARESMPGMLDRSRADWRRRPQAWSRNGHRFRFHDQPPWVKPGGRLSPRVLERAENAQAPADFVQHLGLHRLVHPCLEHQLAFLIA